MQPGLEGLVGAAHGERDESRENRAQRLPRWARHTRSGRFQRAFPSYDAAAIFPVFLEPWRRQRRRWLRWFRKCTSREFSTRSVDALVKALDMTGISKGQVSRLCELSDHVALGHSVSAEPEVQASRSARK